MTTAQHYVAWLEKHGRMLLVASAAVVVASTYLAAFYLPVYADLRGPPRRSMIGYASLLASSNVAIRGFGLASLIGEVTCMSTALVLVPAIVAVGARRIDTAAGSAAMREPGSRYA